MGEVWHLVARIAIGWFGVSFVACGVWIMAAVGMHRLDKTGVAIAGLLLLSGAGLLWCAFSAW